MRNYFGRGKWYKTLPAYAGDVRTTHYGPYHFQEQLIPLMIANALEQEVLFRLQQGRNVRNWFYEKDHCRAIYYILHEEWEGEVYYIGGHNERTNLQVVKTILCELGKPESLIRFVADRSGHDRRYAIAPAKTQKEIRHKKKLAGNRLPPLTTDKKYNTEVFIT